jgi:ketosteroid isomerase-like protein
MYAAFNRRDLDAILALMHDSIEIEPRFGALEGDYRGHEGLRRWWSNLLASLPDYTAEVEEVRDLGHMTSHASGVGDMALSATRPSWRPGGSRAGDATEGASGGVTLRRNVHLVA